MIINIEKVINDQLLLRNPLLDRLRTFCVHYSIIEKCKVFFKLTSDCEILEYELQIGGKFFDMYIVTLPVNYNQNKGFINQLIKKSQISFPWENNPTVFITARSFPILKRFIQNHNLQPYILKIEDQHGITQNDEIIKVVTFDKTVSEFNVIDKYWDYSSSFKSHHFPKYYYLTHAFPWLMPCNHFTIPINNNKFNLVFPVVLRHLSTLNYSNILNIYDLLMLRISLCDFRNPSNYIKEELDFMIKKVVSKLVKNKQLDLLQYTYDKNLTQNNFLEIYLCYEFQNLFQTIQTYRYIDHLKLTAINPNKIVKSIKITPNIIKILNQKHNVEFKIEGRYYEQMRLSLFLKLIACHNVYTINLDTNYQWIQNKSNLKKSITNRTGLIIVRLFGKNCYNFVENYVTSLKMVQLVKGNISLHVYCISMDYKIFGDLSIDVIEFYGNTIDVRMLNDLHNCHLKSDIKLYRSILDNTLTNWQLLNHLKQLIYVEISEDENTMLFMCEYVMTELVKSNSKEFQFSLNNFVVTCGTKRIFFNDITFKIDELNSKLVLHDINSEIVDFYDLKFNVEPNEKSDFDFYQ